MSVDPLGSMAADGGWLGSRLRDPGPRPIHRGLEDETPATRREVAQIPGARAGGADGHDTVSARRPRLALRRAVVGLLILAASIAATAARRVKLPSKVGFGPHPVESYSSAATYIFWSDGTATVDQSNRWIVLIWDYGPATQVKWSDGRSDLYFHLPTRHHGP